MVLRPMLISPPPPHPPHCRTRSRLRSFASRAHPQTHTNKRAAHVFRDCLKSFQCKNNLSIKADQVAKSSIYHTGPGHVGPACSRATWLTSYVSIFIYLFFNLEGNYYVRSTKVISIRLGGSERKCDRNSNICNRQDHRRHSF